MINETTEIAIIIAEQAIAIMRKRGEIYNDEQYDKDIHSKIMLLLYNNGMPNDEIGVKKYKLISYIIDKLCRYMVNSREDNCIDMANYSFLLAAEGRKKKISDRKSKDKRRERFVEEEPVITKHQIKLPHLKFLDKKEDEQ